MDTLLYHPTFLHSIRYLNTTVGRDKILRLLQYLSRFLSFYFLRKGCSTKAIAPLTNIKSQFGLSRKLLRIGKNLEQFKEAARFTSLKSMDPVLRYCAIGRQLGYGIYLSLDHIHYLDASKIYPLNPAFNSKLLKTAQKAWLTGIFFNILSGIYTLYHVNLKTKSTNKLLPESKVEDKRLEKERYEARVQLLSDCCDFLIPATALGVVKADDGVVGLAGCISSLVGLRAAWRKTAGGL